MATPLEPVRRADTPRPKVPRKSVTPRPKASTKSVMPRSNTFFNAHVHDMNRAVSLLALCAGYESGAWRVKGFADHLMQYLAEFALSREEWPGVNIATAYRKLKEAARSVYFTTKTANRGEVGELLLHAVMREHYGSEPRGY